MDKDRKIFAVVGAMLTAAIIAIILLVLYVFIEPVDPTRILASAPAGIIGASGAAIGAYLSKRSPSDERETFIIHQSGMYAWLFLYITLPFLAIFLIYSPPPHGIMGALLLYGIWLIAIIIFSITTLYRNWR